MTIRQAMESMSELEMIAWVTKWREEEEANALKPSLTDWYLMQVAREVDQLRHAFSRRDFKRALKSYTLKNETPPKLTPVEKEAATARARAVWAARLRQ